MPKTKSLWIPEQREKILRILKTLDRNDVILTAEGRFYDNDVGCEMTDVEVLLLAQEVKFKDQTPSYQQKLDFLQELFVLE